MKMIVTNEMISRIKLANLKCSFKIGDKVIDINQIVNNKEDLLMLKMGYKIELGS